MLPFNRGMMNHATSATADDILSNAKEFIKDKLYFTSLAQPPQQHYPNIHFFTIDQTLVYVNFYSDFGPFNLAHVLRFGEIMTEKFQNPLLSNKKICLFSSLDADKRANAAFVLCCYMMFVYKQTAEEAYRPLVACQPPFLPYRDAGYGAATYHITILDCLKGLHKALQLGLLNLDKINLEEYEFFEKVENGDLNWLGDKFIALASPHDDPPNNPRAVQLQGNPNGLIGFGGVFTALTGGVSRIPKQSTTVNSGKLHSVYQIDNLIKFLKEKNVGTIVRLNNKLYERKKFIDAGIEHVELYFPDGTTPPDGILKRFLDLCESRTGPIAVHCKAGLGRTGTLIAAYLIKHYHFTTSEVIGYLRVLRPGSVVGPQQNYLQSMQNKLWKMQPTVPLSPEISCLSPSTFNSFNRFPVFHFESSPSSSALPLSGFTSTSPMSTDGADFDDDFADADDEHDDDENDQGFFDQVERLSSPAHGNFPMQTAAFQSYDQSSEEDVGAQTRQRHSASRGNTRHYNKQKSDTAKNKRDSRSQQKNTGSLSFNTDEHGYIGTSGLSQLQSIPIQPRKTPSAPIVPVLTSKNGIDVWKRAGVPTSTSSGNYTYSSNLQGRQTYGAVVQQQLTQQQLLQDQPLNQAFLFSKQENTQLFDSNLQTNQTPSTNRQKEA